MTGLIPARLVLCSAIEYEEVNSSHPLSRVSKRTFGSFKLSWKGIWKSQDTACFYQHKRGVIHTGDPFLLCVPMADRGIFSDNVKTVWHWIHTRYIPQRGSRDTGCLCQWHIISVLQALGNISLSKKNINWFTVPFNRKRISICFSSQNPTLRKKIRISHRTSGIKNADFYGRFLFLRFRN